MQVVGFLCQPDPIAAAALEQSSGRAWKHNDNQDTNHKQHKMCLPVLVEPALALAV